MTGTLERSIGGYFGLELPRYEGNIERGWLKTNSARSAIKLILKACRPRRVWLPIYICSAVVDTVKELAIELAYYNIDESFAVNGDVRLNSDELILVINYFGVTQNAVERSIERFGGSKVIVDASQAFFSKHLGGIATVWSPRKFFGLPDGGLAQTDDPRILQPEDRDTSSEGRIDHLIARTYQAPEVAYEDFLRAEQEIASLPLLGMSELTERLLCSIDYKVAKYNRAVNALYLHERLKQHNRLDLKLSEHTFPLCYPFLPKIKTATRADLISKRIFLPSYWPEVENKAAHGSFEWNLTTKGLFLPCDQRYTRPDMERILRILGF